MVSSDGVLRARVSLETAVQHLSDDTAAVPRSEEDFLVDIALAGTAVDIATRRHAGRIKDVYFPTGKVRIQRGKDLMKITNVIGTGGIFAYGQEPRRVLQAACWHRDSPESLRPLAPEFLIDEKYILFAVGLLAQSSPKEALRIIKEASQETLGGKSTYIREEQAGECWQLMNPDGKIRAAYTAKGANNRLSRAGCGKTFEPTCPTCGTAVGKRLTFWPIF